MNNFKNLLSSRRKELKMTQKELAEKLNVSDKTISKWETGSSYPEVTLLSTIAKVLDLSINELFDVEDMVEKKVDLEEKESYDYDVINKYKNKIFIILGLIVSSYIIVFTSIVSENENIQVMLIAIGLAIYGFGFVYFISCNVGLRNFYNRKFYTKEYDLVLYKYSVISIILFASPGILATILISTSINMFTIGGIINILSLLIVIASFVALVKVSKITNYIIKKDTTNKILIIIALVLFISIITNLLFMYFLPIAYILVYISIIRNEYVDNV